MDIVGDTKESIEALHLKSWDARTSITEISWCSNTTAQLVSGRSLSGVCSCKDDRNTI